MVTWAHPHLDVRLRQPEVPPRSTQATGQQRIDIDPSRDKFRVTRGRGQ